MYTIPSKILLNLFLGILAAVTTGFIFVIRYTINKTLKGKEKLVAIIGSFTYPKIKFIFEILGEIQRNKHYIRKSKSFLLG